MSPLRWILFLCVVVSVKCEDGFLTILEYLDVNYTKEWNEDLEPVIESLGKRLQKELFPIVQEILYDEEISTECLTSFARLSSGLNQRKLWAFKRELTTLSNCRETKPAEGPSSSMLHIIFGPYGSRASKDSECKIDYA